MPLRFFRNVVLALVIFIWAGSHVLAQDDAARRADLQLLLDRLLPSRPPQTGRISALDKTWEDWVRRTGELPPDFNAMRSQAELPNPLVIEQGGREIPVTDAAQWNQKRQWIRGQVEQWIFGRMPPRPDNLRVASSTERREGGITIREVKLEFGPGHRAQLNLELLIPDGDGPFPVFLTNHSPRQAAWIHTAVARGYIGCYYRATDPRYGDPDDSDAYIDLYPDYDFSCLARWAWAASRAVDYLETRPEVIARQIGIAGHSRNGKQALLAAAFDERIGAVIASSGLTGEAHPWRYTSDPFAVESVQLLTGAQSHWFHPRLRFFAGREHKLPVDQNSLMALVAPRGLMIYAAYTEASASTFALEKGYRNVRDVYRFLGRDQNAWLHLRDGEHGTHAGDVEHFIDFLDSVFGRRSFAKKETWLHNYDFAEWQKNGGERVDASRFPVRRPGDFLQDASGAPLSLEKWAPKAEAIRATLGEVLGKPAPPVAVPPQRRLVENTAAARNPVEAHFDRPVADAAGLKRLADLGMGLSSLSYGPGLRADVFYPLTAEKKMKPGRHPVVVWLHPYAHANGWSAKLPWRRGLPDYMMDQRPSFDSLVRRGFIVVAFDQIGFGGRVHEGAAFYGRYPEWSLLGKMVADTSALVRVVRGLEQVDASRIYLLGYSLGAKVGLFTAALGSEVRGVVAVSGVFPLRLQADGDGTEGLRHYSHLHGLLPKLGYFIGQETRVPFDYDEVLAAAAPRRVLVVAPKLDRYAPVSGVRKEVEAAQAAFRLTGRPNALELWTPADFNRFPRTLQEEVFGYLERSAREDDSIEPR